MTQRTTPMGFHRLRRMTHRIPGVQAAVRGIKKLAGKDMVFGPDGIQRIGHREYIGGRWDEIGQLQFDFLKSQGLKPHHYFLDVGCGSLRAGVHLIPYLEAGHYMGLEKEQLLIDAGLNDELPADVRDAKDPQLICSDCFDFSTCRDKADYAIAQSLFSHLRDDLVHMCFANLRSTMAADGSFYATFHEVDSKFESPDKETDYGCFQYTPAQMEEFGTANGWEAHYIGNWNHPRDQVMVRYTPAS